MVIQVMLSSGIWLLHVCLLNVLCICLLKDLCEKNQRGDVHEVLHKIFGNIIQYTFLLAGLLAWFSCHRAGGNPVLRLLGVGMQLLQYHACLADIPIAVMLCRFPPTLSVSVPSNLKHH